MGRLLTILVIAAAMLSVPVPVMTAMADEIPQQTSSPSAYGRLPLYFIENRGQVGEAENHELADKRESREKVKGERIEAGDVSYFVQGQDKTLYFTPQGITISLAGEDKRWTVKLDFVDANPDAGPHGEDQQEAVYSYFKGKPEDWKVGIPIFKKLAYRDLWPGIDLIYSGTADRLKYEFVVAPGTDPGRIRLAYRGATEVAVTEGGTLKVTTPLCGFEDGKPLAYQDTDQGRVEVDMGFALGAAREARDTGETREDRAPKSALSQEHTDGHTLSHTTTYTNTHTYGFEVGPYDRAKPLILDPVILVYCGFIGGDANDRCEGIAVDADGCAYVTGVVWSTELSFPVKVGPDLTFNGGDYDAFIAKVNGEGTDLEYCGYIGGGNFDSALAAAVDGDGRAYVFGHTSSKQAKFPVTVGPDLTFNGGGADTFVARVNAQGTALEYCGYIGGSQPESGFGIAVDDNDCAYVTGVTWSTESSFPVKVGPDLTFNGGDTDAFVAKVNAAGTDLDYCGYIGGKSDEGGRGIDVDDSGCAFVGGTTSSEAASFPVKGGPDLTFNGGYQDAFVAKVKADGTELDYCGYIGGAALDYGWAISVDGESRAYVAGSTQSDESSFPVKTGPDLTYNGYPWQPDGFLTRLDAAGQFDYCGYVGGGYIDLVFGVAADQVGHAYVTGWTSSTETTFPVKAGPILTYTKGYDAFVARVNLSGTGFDYCGYLGGDEDDLSRAVAIDTFGNAYVGGYLVSTETSFPVKGGPDLTFNGGYYDVFVAKVSLALSVNTHKLSAGTGGTVDFSLFADQDKAGRSYFLLGSLSGTEPGLALPGGAILPLNWDVLTELIYRLANTPLLANFHGTLDSAGRASAKLDTLGPLPSAAVGETLQFAYLLYGPFDFVSNAEAVEITP